MYLKTVLPKPGQMDCIGLESESVNSNSGEISQEMKIIRPTYAGKLEIKEDTRSKLMKK